MNKGERLRQSSCRAQVWGFQQRGLDHYFGKPARSEGPATRRTREDSQDTELDEDTQSECELSPRSFSRLLCVEQEALPSDHGSDQRGQDSLSESTIESESPPSDSPGRPADLGPGTLHGDDLRRDVDQAPAPRYDDPNTHLEEIAMWLAAAFRADDEELQVIFFNEIAEFFQ